MSGLVAENQALIAKLGELVTDKDELEEELMQINYTLKKKIAAQQTAQGEVPDSLGLSPKERKALKKVFAKFDKDGNGTIEANELQAVAEEFGEPLSEEEIAEGMSAMGGGSVDFAKFEKWIGEQRDMEEHKGIKARMLMMKMRAKHLQKQVEAGTIKKPSFAGSYTDSADNDVKVSVGVGQNDVAAKTKIDVTWCPKPEADGRAAMAAVGVPGDANAAIVVNIALLPGVDSAAEGTLSAIYEQLFDMISGDEQMEMAKEKFYLHSKPTCVVADVEGTKCLQIKVPSTLDIFEMAGMDSRYLKKIEVFLNWAHTADEMLASNPVDLFNLEGIKAGGEVVINRKIVEWMASSPEIQSAMSDGPMGEDFNGVLAGALCFGDASVNVSARSLMEIFNKDLRESFPQYNEFATDLEEKRMLDFETMVLGMLNAKIVEFYCGAPQLQDVYKEFKGCIAGPHSVKVMLPTGELALSTKGLDVINAFLPSVETIEAHESFGSGDGGDDDDDW